jgi:hypothetical protein
MVRKKIHKAKRWNDGNPLQPKPHGVINELLYFLKSQRTRRPSPGGLMGTCLICGQQEALVSKVHNMDAFTIECEVCGRCLIERILPQIWKTLAGEEKSLVLYLPAYIREENRKGNEPAITRENWKEYAGIPKKTSYQDKIKKFLKLIDSRAQSLDEFVPIDARTDYPLCDLRSANEIDVLEKEAEEKDYVEFQRGNGRCYRLKVKGRDLLSVEKELEKPTLRQQSESFIDLERLSQLKAIPKGQFDLTKLIRICEELDLCFKNECYLAVAALMRALIDHVPPIFQCKTFTEVANNFSGAKSFKESMKTFRRICPKDRRCVFTRSDQKKRNSTNAYPSELQSRCRCSAWRSS